MLRNIIGVICGALILVVIAYFVIKPKEINMNYTEIHAEHILVNSEQEAGNIRSDIEENKISFEDAAKKYSSCPSGKSGGDLGFFRKGMMVKEFENAAFSLEPGKISNPVKTQFGWHLIKVIERK